MNYLAHLYLSGSDEQIMVGNFAGDYIKGTKWKNYPEKIGKGVRLHRQIDSFTDNHHFYKEAKMFFKPGLGLYSGIVVDFVYDHYLANNWTDYSAISLKQFSHKAHAALIRNFFHLPGEVQRFLPFLIKNKRLESYASIDGVTEALKIMSNYSSLPEKSDFVKTTLHENYAELENNFRQYMPLLINFVKENYDL